MMWSSKMVTSRRLNVSVGSVAALANGESDRPFRAFRGTLGITTTTR